MSVAAKCRLGHHEGVPETPEVCGILHFSGEDVTWIDFSGDMSDSGSLVLMGFADFIFAKINVLGPFVCHRRSPINAGLIVVEDVGAVVGVADAKIFGTVFHCRELFYAFICC